MSTSGPAAVPPPGLGLAPFRGLRFAPGRVRDLASVTAPPYDVVVRPDGRERLETADPHNVVRLILPNADAPATRASLAAATLRRWQTEGVLTPDPRPALYVYEQREPDGTTQRGLIGALRLPGPGEHTVLPHEDTMPGPVADRAALMRATAANLEPLLLSYPGGDGPTGAADTVGAAARTPPLVSTTTEDGVRHRLWAVTAPDRLAAVRADLATRRALIADGHHRWAAYLRLRDEHRTPGPWDHGLVLLVDSDRHPLRVRAIHRVLPGLAPTRAAELAAAPGTGFRVTALPEGTGPEAALAALGRAAADGNAFLLAGDGRFRLLTVADPATVTAAIRADRPAAWRRLDAAVLHGHLLPDVWRVPSDTAAPGPGEAVRYLHDVPSALDQAARAGGTAVLMHPVTEGTVLDLARRGVTMPQKSTSFGPKPAGGLVLRSLALEPGPGHA
jgi:uncharacterized protein (DUF1015 family)